MSHHCQEYWLVLSCHKVSQYNSRFNCRECNKKHHTSLCHAFATNTVPPQQDPPNETLTTMTSTSLSTSYTSVCLLKTAIADISAGYTTVEGHILFDKGAQHSFITQELADKLQLQPIRYENICVSSFGAQVSAPRRLAVASVLVHILKEGPIPTSVLIVPKLAALICNSIRAHLNNLPYLKGLPLVHPVTSGENFHISVLILLAVHSRPCYLWWWPNSCWVKIGIPPVVPTTSSSISWHN